MIPAPIPNNEELRLEILRSLNFLDSSPDLRLDAITKFAAESLNAPMCLISLIDAERQWYKSSYGVDSTECSREIAICAHAIYEVATTDPFGRIFEVNDTKDDSRFYRNPTVVGSPHIRSYLGYVLQSDAGLNLGTLCIDDTVPRQFTDLNKQMLILLGCMAENILHGRNHLEGINHNFG